MRGHVPQPLIGQYFQMRESWATTPLVEIMRDQSLQPLIGQYFQMRESRASTPLVEIMRDQSLQPLICQYFQMRESRATTPLVEDYDRPWSSASNYNYYATTNYSRPSTPEPVRYENTIVRLWFFTFRIFEWSMTSVIIFGRLFGRFVFFHVLIL